MARQVCANDPRTFGQRRADALGVLAARGDRLACQCGNPECPAAGPDARATSVVIHVLTDALPAPMADPLLSGDPAAPLTPRAPQPGPTPAPHPAMSAETPARQPELVDETTPDAAPVPAPAPASAPVRAPAPVRTPVGYVVGGPVIPPAQLADLVARGAKVRTVASATDLGGVPRYRPSTAIDEFVRMRAMTCMFPGCDQPATACDVDHTVPWPAGPTHPGNLSPKCRKHHLLKTFYSGPDGWRDRQQSDGTIVWTAPTGHTYISVPGSRILFPHKQVDTPLPDGPPSNVTDLDTPPAPGRGIMMPIRRRTRAQNQAQRVAYERALNEADLQAIAAGQEAADRRHAAREAARETGENDIPPPH